MRIALGIVLFVVLLGTSALFLLPSDMVVGYLDPSLSADTLEQQIILLKTKGDASLLRNARQGDPEAQFRVGEQYLLGTRTKKDPAEALSWLQKAAKQGHLRAQYELGRMYWDGRGIARDYEQAAYWMRQCADGGSANGQFGLASLLVTGRGVPRNAMLAIDYFEKAAIAGMPEALQALKDFAAHGSKATQLGVLAAYVSSGPDSPPLPEDPAEVRRKEQEAAKAARIKDPKFVKLAHQFLRFMAERGDAKAQGGLGMVLLSQDNPAAQAEGVTWLRKAADQGNAQACFVLSAAYLSGKGVEKDEATARDWLQRSADAGYADGQFLLGAWLAKKSGPKADQERAPELFAAAARQGHSRAQFFLGFYHERGKFMPRDMGEAVRW